MNHPSQQLSFCIQGFDVWFGTLYWFINAVIHFSKLLSSLVSNLQNHILEKIFSSSGWGFVSLGGWFAGDFLSHLTSFLPISFLLSTRQKKVRCSKSRRARNLEVDCQNYCYSETGPLCLYLHLNGRVRNKSPFSLSLPFLIKENKSFSSQQAILFVSGVLGHRPPSSLCSPSIHFCRTCYGCLWEAVTDPG